MIKSPSATSIQTGTAATIFG